MSHTFSRYSWPAAWVLVLTGCGGGGFQSGERGAGGSSSEAGGSGGAVSTGGSAATITCDNLPLNALSLLYLCVTPAQTSTSVAFAVEIRSGTPVPLRALTVRYWYPSPAGVVQNYQVNYSTGDFVAPEVMAGFYPTYLELGFPQAMGSVTPSTPAVLSGGFFEPSYGYSYDQTLAWSFNATLTADLACWDHVTLYRDGVLVFGQEP